MAQEIVEIVEGWSARLDFCLKENGEAKDLSAFTMTAEAVDRNKRPVTLTGNLGTLTATAGTVRLIPDTGDFPAAGSPYELRFRATAGSEVAYYPSGEPVAVEVRRWP